MVNYKKSLMSIAAAIAISSTALTAGYLPLTDGTNDNRWVLFGVTGFKTDGVTSSEAGQFSITDDVKYAITDTSGDEFYTSGLTVSLKDFGRLEAMGSSDIEIRVDTTGVIWDETDPFRTIYVDTETAGYFAFTYKASLEGKTLEYKVGTSGAVHELVINYENVYSNPAVGTTTVGGSGDTGAALSSIADTVDYNLSGNPVLVSEYDKDTYQTTWVNETLRLYSYDAENEKWDIYDRLNTSDANDFESFTKGKGYWGKIDADGSGNDFLDADGQEAGFVLDSATLTTTDYAASGIAEGWNLMAFDSAHSDIRYATTGLIATFVAAADSFTLEDFSGNHSVTVTLTVADDKNTIAKKINSAINAAKVLGTIPKTFDLKAFPTDTLLQVALVSNKKFTLKDTNDATIGAVTTLAGLTPLDPTTLEDSANGGDVLASGVMSKYGEYSMVIEALHAAYSDDTASNLSEGASVQVVGDTVANTSATSIIEIGATLSATVTNLDAHADLSGVLGNVVEIDADINGTTDNILLTSVKPFYLRDHTFSRVYTYSGTAAGADSTLVITSPTLANVTLDTTDTNATRAANDINGTVAMGAGTPSTDLTKIVFTMDASTATKFEIAETVGDNLKASTTSSDMAKGAVKGIYSLGYLATLGIKNNVEINITEIPDRNDTIQFSFDTRFDTGILGTVMNPNEDGTYANTDESDATENEALLDAYVTQINLDLEDANITARASHNYNNGGAATPAGDLNASLITISGAEVINVDTTVVNDDRNVSEVFTMEFTGGTPDNNTSYLHFDGTVIDLNASSLGVDINTTAEMVFAFWEIYDGNGTANWNVTNELNTTLTFTADVNGSKTDIAIGDFNDSAISGLAATFTVTRQGISPSTAEANITTAADLGYVTTITPDLTADLKYNAIYTPNYVMDGPLYTMRNNNMKLNALVTGTMSLSDGVVTWDSIDLTRPPSEWLDSQDYNLFATDETSGYWAYLSNDASNNPLSITAASVAKNYTHNFDTDGDTFNHYAGKLEVAIDGVDGVEYVKSSRVVATVGGETIELIRESGSSDTFIGQISSYEANEFTSDTNYDITITVADGLGNKLSQDLTADLPLLNASFDNVKPAKPTLTTTNGLDLGITFTSADTASVYVFQNFVPENYTTGDELFKMTSTDPEWAGTTQNICKVMDEVTVASSAGNLVAIALDGDGVLGSGAVSTGNASDQFQLPYMPILKGKVYVENQNTGAKTITTGGSEYNSTCEVATVHTNTGVTLSAIDEITAKIAYEFIDSEDLYAAVPITTYLSDGTNVVEIKYDPAYVGTGVFVMIDGVTYTHTLLSAAAIVTAGDGEVDTNPTDISATEITGVTF